MPFAHVAHRRSPARSRLAALAVALPMLAFAGPSVAEDKVVAKIDGVAVTETELAAVMTDFAQQLSRLPESERRRIALDRLVDMRLIAAQAQKDGIDKGAEFQRRLAQARTQLLTSEYVKQKVEGAVTDAMIQARYDQEIKAYDPPEEVRARHILVKTVEEAKAIVDELGKGGDFAKIAAEKSLDPGSKVQGGDLGFFGRGQMVPPFEEAAFGLGAGEITKEPVQSQFGFHVIKVEEKRKQPVPKLEEVKDQIREIVASDVFREKVDGLKKAAKIEIVDPALKDAPKQ